MRFTFDKKEPSLRVPQFLNDWGKSLQEDFFAVDPNNKLRKDSWTGSRTPRSGLDILVARLVAHRSGFIALGLKHILAGADHTLFEFEPLSIVAVCVPLTLRMFRRRWLLRASSVLSGALIVIGLAWFIERVL